MKNKAIYFLLSSMITLASCSLFKDNEDILTINPSFENFEINNTNITSCLITAEIKDDGGTEVTETGVCWSSEMEPTINNEHKKCDENTYKLFQQIIEKLSPNKTYHVRAYAKNKKGYGYSNSITIKTLSGETAIATESSTNINFTTATLNANISNISNFIITKTGFCWSTSPNPTTANNYISTISTEGLISSDISGLTASTTYYVRAYVSNSSEVIYGNEVSFTTTTVLTLQPGSEGKDGYINMNSNTPHDPYYGLNALAWTNSGLPLTTRSLIEFDLSSIPIETKIRSAYLSLYNDPTSLNNSGKHSEASVYPTTGGDNGVYLKRVTSPWEEDIVIWDTQPTTTDVNQVYLEPSTDPHQDYEDIDVTVLIQDMLDNTNHGFMLTLKTEEIYRGLVFASSDNADPTNHPKLVVTY